MIGYYYKVLDTNQIEMENEMVPLIAASVIKLPIMIEAFHQIDQGIIDPNGIHILKEEEKMPSCGALNRMHNGLEVTIRDLIELMIVLSDNTATNILIDLLGMDHINHYMNELDLHITKLNRKLFDHTHPGVENYICAYEIGKLLEMIYHHELAYSEDMLEILLNQKLNGKIPFYLHSQGIKVAHKTGEDTGISHDVGIIFTKEPFILVMLSNEVNVPEFEREIQDTARKLSGL